MRMIEGVNLRYLISTFINVTMYPQSKDNVLTKTKITSTKNSSGDASTYIPRYMNKNLFKAQTEELSSCIVRCAHYKNPQITVLVTFINSGFHNESGNIAQLPPTHITLSEFFHFSQYNR
jgi:hypothetical protein